MILKVLNRLELYIFSRSGLIFSSTFSTTSFLLSLHPRDFADFLEDLEEDVEMRGNVLMYRDASKGLDTDSEFGDDAPRIGLDEMLEDLETGDQAEEMEDDEGMMA